jgi:hypothetical protein
MSSEEELDIQRKIDLYLSNAMTASERRLFEQQMNEDSKLREEVLVQKSIAERLFDGDVNHISNTLHDKELAEVKNTLQSDSYQEHQKHIALVGQVYQKRKQRRKRWLSGTVATILLLISSVFWFPSQPSYESLYATYADWNEITSYIEQSDVNNFAKGELLYRDKNYREAILFFESFTKDTSAKMYAPGLLYLGASYVGNNELTKALTAFDQLIQSDSYDRSKGYWYKLLIYLKQENTTEIENTLELILQDSSNFNYQKALKIRESL